MNILPYNLATTKDLLTSRAGLVCVATLMQSIDFVQAVNHHFSQPQSNRGFKPSVFVTSMMLMLHEGGKCLDDLQYIRQDKALRLLLGLNQVPESDSLGDWLRRIGQSGVSAVTEVNRTLLKRTLHKIKTVTLDIDAMLACTNKQSAQWSYKKCKGYMPMIGTLAETGQIVATEFRAGNVAPAFDNLGFIKHCESALPEGVSLSALRIDAAGYQAEIINMCQERNIKYAIRAKMHSGLKKQIQALGTAQWQPLRHKDGTVSEHEMTARMVHTMAGTKQSFTLIVQRQTISGQQILDFDEPEAQEEIRCGRYLYRAIAVSENTKMSDSDWVYWYNQRGEHCENRIKELKSDFSAGKLPCQDFHANSLYFALCSLAYNLFVLLRIFLPVRFESSRAKSVRLRIFALAGKVVKHGRKLYLKLQEYHHQLLAPILTRLAFLSFVT